MPAVLSKVFDIILAFLLFFLCPLYLLTQSCQNDIQIYVMEKVSSFADSVRNGGYVSRDMMEVLQRELKATGNAYEIRMTHEHKVYMPETDENGIVTGEVQVQYQNAYEDVILDEVYNGSGEYGMTEGDYFSVEITSAGLTLAQRVENIIFGRHGNGVSVVYGGRVRDDLL